MSGKICSLLLRYRVTYPAGFRLAGTRSSRRSPCLSHRLLEGWRKQMSPYQIQISFCMFSRGECQQERESRLKMCVATCRDRANGYISLSADEQSTSWCRGMFPLCSLWDRNKTVIVLVLIHTVYSHTLYIQTHLVPAKQ